MIFEATTTSTLSVNSFAAPTFCVVPPPIPSLLRPRLSQQPSSSVCNAMFRLFPIFLDPFCHLPYVSLFPDCFRYFLFLRLPSLFFLIDEDPFSRCSATQLLCANKSIFENLLSSSTVPIDVHSFSYSNVNMSVYATAVPPQHFHNLMVFCTTTLYSFLFCKQSQRLCCVATCSPAMVLQSLTLHILCIHTTNMSIYVLCWLLL